MQDLKQCNMKGKQITCSNCGEAYTRTKDNKVEGKRAIGQGYCKVAMRCLACGEECCADRDGLNHDGLNGP